MEYPSKEIQQLFEQARAYEQQQDPYNAIKLYKRSVKLAPEWSAAYERLGHIYRDRQEWKPALHYNKKTVSLAPGNQEAWWALGIAATALRKWRIARSVWQKFGVTPKAPRNSGPIAIKLHYAGQFEILWARSLDPVRARILNIPHPASDRAFRDVVLHDGQVNGYNVAGNKRYPIYCELGLFKASHFQTFSCYLQTQDSGDIEMLERLCREQGIGFEVWSNASKAMHQPGRTSKAEYHSADWLQELSEEGVLVALAARRESEVRKVLQSWEVISLKPYNDLERHE